MGNGGTLGGCETSRESDDSEGAMRWGGVVIEGRV